MGNDKYINTRVGKLFITNIYKKYDKQMVLRRYCECKCDCGKLTIMRLDSVIRADKRGIIKSCGCYRDQLSRQIKKDLTGQRFGRLIVISSFVLNTKKNRIMWNCICDCGQETSVRAGSLKNGFTKSCGCLQKEIMSQNKKLLCNKYEDGEGAANLILTRYKSAAKKYNRQFDLTREEFIKLTSANCYYCGIKPYRNALSKKTDGAIIARGEYVYNGIDRIDSNIGYILSNCVSACTRCNQAKNNMPIHEFTNWLIDIYNCFILKHGV